MVYQMELGLAQGSEPMGPSLDGAAAEGEEDQLTAMFHIGQMRQRRVLRVEQHRNSPQKVNVIGAFHDD
jgi:hypothetical protein